MLVSIYKVLVYFLEINMYNPKFNINNDELKIQLSGIAAMINEENKEKRSKSNYNSKTYFDWKEIQKGLLISTLK